MNEETEIKKTDEEWRQILSPEQYAVLREKGTEPPGTGEYYHTTEKGMYLCAACGNELFMSDTKYDSGSGWPSFYAAKEEKSVAMSPDMSHGTIRTEITCSRCGSHLGHVFDDGPPETGKRFCVNSLSLILKKPTDASPS